MEVRPLSYEEYFIYAAEYLPLSAGTGTDFREYQVKIAKDANFKLRGMTYIADDARILFRFREDAFGRYLQKGNMDMRAMVGRPITGPTAMGAHQNEFYPFVYSRPYRLQAGSTLTVEAAENSNASNNVRLALHGSKVRTGIPPWQETKYRYTLPFIYEANVGTIAANGSATAVITIDQSSDFLVRQITGVRTGAATILLSESARGRDWMDRATHFDNVVGLGFAPNRLLQTTPRFLRHGSNLTVAVTDLSGASNVVRVYFEGEQLFV